EAVRQLAVRPRSPKPAREAVSEPAPLPADSVASVLSIVQYVCRPLDYIHGMGIVHRDLKPQNIWVQDSDGLTAKLMDFGLAQDRGGSERLTGEGTMILGTFAYMAPELWRGEEADARADIYALGVVL